jgi:hypothetical protein
MELIASYREEDAFFAVFPVKETEEASNGESK